MGHNDVRSLFIEYCGSTSTMYWIVTRATMDRKPRPRKRTPYEDFNAFKVKVNVKTLQGIVH